MILTDTAKTALLTGLKNALNQGGDNSNYATLNFYDSDNNLLAQCPIDNNDGVIVTGQLTFTPSGQPAVLKSGSIVNAQIYDDMSNLLIDGLTVGTSNADVVVGSVNVQAGGILVLQRVVFSM